MCKIYFFILEHPIGCMAVFISLLALITTIVFNVRDHRHKRLSVKPLITAVSKRSLENEVVINLQNNGIGPAIIDEIEFTFKGKKYNDMHEYFHEEIKGTALYERIDYDPVRYLKSVKGAAFKVGDEFPLFLTTITSGSFEDIEEVLAIVNSVDVTIKYRDIYNKKFTKEM